jgi:thymidylate synthase (FAD)
MEKEMKVELLNNTPLWVCAKAIRKCWASESKSDTELHEVEYDYRGKCTKVDFICGEKDKELIYRIGNKNKHKSTLEHLVYTFDIDGISRACLQEVARHRIASYSVKSTRYTLKELKEENNILKDGYTFFSEESLSVAPKYIVMTGDKNVDGVSVSNLGSLQRLLKSSGVANDIGKYPLPESYKTSLVMTINARSLQNFLELRTSKSALWEIRDLAKAMLEALPEEHKYLFR